MEQELQEVLGFKNANGAIDQEAVTGALEELENDLLANLDEVNDRIA